MKPIRLLALTGRTTLVTGRLKGIAKASARRFAQAGADIISRGGKEDA